MWPEAPFPGSCRMAHFLFVSWPGSGRATLRVGSLRSTDSQALMEVDSNVLYGSGHLLYMRGDSLVAQPFDADSLRTTGEAVLVAEPVQRVRGLISIGAFSVSQAEVLAFQRGVATSVSRLTWVDREGNAIGSLGDARPFCDIRLSADGRNLLASAQDDVGNFDLWKFDLAQGLTSRFTMDDGGEYYGVWRRMGRRCTATPPAVATTTCIAPRRPAASKNWCLLMTPRRYPPVSRMTVATCCFSPVGHASSSGACHWCLKGLAQHCADSAARQGNQ